MVAILVVISCGCVDDLPDTISCDGKPWSKAERVDAHELESRHELDPVDINNLRIIVTDYVHAGLIEQVDTDRMCLGSIRQRKASRQRVYRFYFETVDIAVIYEVADGRVEDRQIISTFFGWSPENANELFDAGRSVYANVVIQQKMNEEVVKLKQKYYGLKLKDRLWLTETTSSSFVLSLMSKDGDPLVRIAAVSNVRIDVGDAERLAMSDSEQKVREAAYCSLIKHLDERSGKEIAGRWDSQDTRLQKESPNRGSGQTQLLVPRCFQWQETACKTSSMSAVAGRAEVGPCRASTRKDAGVTAPDYSGPNEFRPARHRKQRITSLCSTSSPASCPHRSFSATENSEEPARMIAIANAPGNRLVIIGVTDDPTAGHSTTHQGGSVDGKIILYDSDPLGIGPDHDVRNYPDEMPESLETLLVMIWDTQFWGVKTLRK